ncbi:ubiquitin thioesterase otulin isoform X1 [Acipenser oxyrinchus oxyrinchus]|uniref:Ubiquitin thioesterase otulin isoform X1 n=1 Tax=Acipenser oxyrinchus oxyrinchus TaxID=40147 RepID=A0AAD8GGM5_ACIOX|nr:ubiquitin thioesterase otulin isoform X1 [Acipenser oxyrinchus oxyrinchus]
MGSCCSGPPAQPEETKGWLVKIENEQDSTSKNHVATQAEARREVTDAPLQSDKEDEHLYNGVRDKSQENNHGVTPVDRVAEGGVVMPACSETVAEEAVAVHQESESISLPKRKTVAAGPEHTAHTAFAGSITEATVTQEEHKQPASSAETKSGKFPVIEKINQTACIDNLQHGNGPAGLVNDAVQEDKSSSITEAASEDYSSLASSSSRDAVSLAEESERSERSGLLISQTIPCIPSCTVEEKAVDTQAFESPDQPDSVLEVNIGQSLENIGEDLTKEGKKAKVAESTVYMKDIQKTPSIEMEPESQSVTQEKSSAPKPLKSLDEEPMREMCAAVEDEDNTSEVDLYRGAEEIEEDQLEKNGAKCVDDFMDKCSISPEVDMLIYSENEWRGNTAKSAQIKKAYEEVHKSFSGLRRVRGDNYCALRATLFQALVQSKKVPAWLQREDFIQLPEKLASCYDWLKQWRFTQEYTNGNWMELLKGHMQLLKRKWLAVVESSSAEERQAVCDEIFRNEEEEHSLLEAVKLLMLNTAIELYNDIQQEKDVPIFCWLLFARDSSDTPCTFLSNHLNQVGFSGGLEQVEMFLLGYALELTIHVYRLYKFETDEFLTFYPDDHKEDWPVVSLITEDDRHYNVPVQKQDTARL